MTTLSAMRLAAAGCTGSARAPAEPAEASQGPALEGIYRYSLTPEYLVESGVTPAQAEEEHGVHTVTVSDGQYSDSWSNDTQSKTCTGTYSWEGSRMTVLWNSGCSGDWAMTAQVAGDQITWTDIESLPPDDDAYSQTLNEAFNGVPWTRVGDAQDAAGS